jgi:hypothetical protein
MDTQSFFCRIEGISLTPPQAQSTIVAGECGLLIFMVVHFKPSLCDINLTYPWLLD